VSFRIIILSTLCIQSHTTQQASTDNSIMLKYDALESKINNCMHAASRVYDEVIAEMSKINIDIKDLKKDITASSQRFEAIEKENQGDIIMLLLLIHLELKLRLQILEAKLTTSPPDEEIIITEEETRKKSFLNR
jgi:hypothetical protein